MFKNIHKFNSLSTHLLSPEFDRLEVWAWHHLILFSRSFKLKSRCRLGCLPIWSLIPPPYSWCYVRNQFLEFVGLRSLIPCWLSHAVHSQLLEGSCFSVTCPSPSSKTAMYLPCNKSLSCFKSLQELYSPF